MTIISILFVSRKMTMLFDVFFCLLASSLLNLNYYRDCRFEPLHDKTNNMSVRPAKTQISLGICPVWLQFLLCAQWVAKNPRFLHAGSEDWSDWADAQADPSLRWAHSHFVGFVMSRLIFSHTKVFSLPEIWPWFWLLFIYRLPTHQPTPWKYHYGFRICFYYL